ARTAAEARRAAAEDTADRRDWRRAVDGFLAALFANLHLNFGGTTRNRQADPASGEVLFLLRHRIPFARLFAGEGAGRGLHPDFAATGDGLEPMGGDGLGAERFAQYENLEVVADFFGFSLTAQAIIFHEYWTLTIFLSLHRGAAPDAAAGTAPPELAAIRAEFDRIAAFAEDRFAEHWHETPAAGRTAPTEDSLAETRLALVEGFRSLVHRTVLRPALLRARWQPAVPDEPAPGEEPSFAALGRRFADLNGQVFGFRLHDAPAKRHATSGAPLDAKAPAASAFRVGSDAGMKTLHGRTLQVPLDTHLAPRVADAHWPFFKALHAPTDPEERRHFDQQTEVVAASFQDGRALFVSSVGRMHASTFNAGQPVIYTLIVTYRSHWQLGRLVDRLHEAETLRLCALWDFPALQQAHRDMLELERELRWEARGTGDASALQQHEAAMRRLEGLVSGGLSRRLNRADYYIGQLEDALPRFRIGRIEGFQPYDEFLGRRLFPSFEHIRRTRQLWQTILQLYDIAIERATQAGIEDTQRSTARTQKDIETLLDNAELLIAAPVAYYLGVILGTLAEALGHKGADVKLAAFIVSVLLVACGVVWLKLRRDARRRAEEGREGP
uniref:DUF3422 family protein n=1 Tax=Falsiroseomonas oryzae TaxID=2766473 RepID=UPI0022EA7DEF